MQDSVSSHQVCAVGYVPKKPVAMRVYTIVLMIEHRSQCYVVMLETKDALIRLRRACRTESKQKYHQAVVDSLPQDNIGRHYVIYL